MTKKIRRLTALLLSLAMILGLTACSGGSEASSGSSGSGSGSSGGGSAGSAAMGRYVETREPLPEGVNWVSEISQLPDGTLRMLGGGGVSGPWSVFSSGDGGRSWTPIDYPWLGDLTGSSITSATLTADGAYLIYTRGDYVTGSEKSESSESTTADAEPIGATGAEEADPAISDEDSAGDSGANAGSIGAVFAYGDASGLSPVPFELAPEGESAVIFGLSSAPNGDLIIHDGVSEVRQVDTVNWKVKNTYRAAGDPYRQPGFTAYDNTLAIYNADSTIALYDIDSGALLDEFKAGGKSTNSVTTTRPALISAATDGSAWLYCNESGLFRVPMGTTVSERLLDGGLSSLGVPNLVFISLFGVGESEYIAVAIGMTDGAGSIFRYTYDPDIPTEPSQVVKVYSLRDSRVVRQAISGFQTHNPDVRVEYQLGLSESGGGVTAADAMRSLSTELLAGKGPDVLVLDDMDVDGYVGRGILADISDVLTDIDTLTNVTGAYSKDGALFAIPARFSIPVLIGDGVDSLKDLDDLTAWLGTKETYDIGIQSDKLMERFYAAFSYRWFTPDGKLDEAAFRADLEQLGKLTREIDALGTANDDLTSMPIGTLLWYGGAISAAYGKVGGFLEIALFELGVKQRPAGRYTVFPSDQGGVFIPSSILGVNVAAVSPDTGKAFVKYVLSEEVQSVELDGFPVNSAALETLSKGPDNIEDIGRAVMSMENARTGEMVEVNLPVEWPSEAFLTGFKTLLRGASIPVKSNAVIREMIIDETSGYLGGNASLDDVVASLKQKMELYLSEQA